VVDQLAEFSMLRARTRVTVGTTACGAVPHM
jgi:hypothetical protein